MQDRVVIIIGKHYGFDFKKPVVFIGQGNLEETCKQLHAHICKLYPNWAAEHAELDWTFFHDEIIDEQITFYKDVDILGV